VSGQRGCRSDGFGALGSVSDRQLDSCAAAGVDALAQRGRRTAATQALLSMGHNSRPPILKIWSDGARADIPAIPDLNPNRYSRGLMGKPQTESKRGNVTKFSDKSRRRLLRDIAKIKLSEITYTSVLSLPGVAEEFYLNHEFVKKCFERFMRRLASQKRFFGVSGYWKREVQDRGALHYHFLIYGLHNIALKEEFRSWLVKTWNELMCAGIDPIKKEHHRWLHAKDKNFQEVRNMSGYFSKYISKDVDDDAALAGRWWGSFNKSKLPYAEEMHSELSMKAAVLIHRAARKLRKIKANTAKSISDQKALKEVGSRPTEMQMFRLRNGSLRDGTRNPKRAKEILALYEEVKWSPLCCQ
jgi:hypothetical protein